MKLEEFCSRNKFQIDLWRIIKFRVEWCLKFFTNFIRAKFSKKSFHGNQSKPLHGNHWITQAYRVIQSWVHSWNPVNLIERFFMQLDTLNLIQSSSLFFRPSCRSRDHNVHHKYKFSFRSSNGKFQWEYVTIGDWNSIVQTISWKIELFPSLQSKKSDQSIKDWSSSLTCLWIQGGSGFVTEFHWWKPLLCRISLRTSIFAKFGGIPGCLSPRSQVLLTLSLVPKLRTEFGFLIPFLPMKNLHIFTKQQLPIPFSG